MTPMSSSAAPTSELDNRRREDLARLYEALAVERQRFEVAVAIVGMLSDRVDDPDDLTAIIHDIVLRWRMLNRAAQELHRDPALHVGPLTVFAWLYVDQVALAAFADVPEDLHGELPADEAASMEIGHWQVHIARIRTWCHGHHLPATARSRCS